MVNRKEDFPSVFERLKALLEEHEPALVVTDDGPESYSLDAPRAGGYKKPHFFGAVHVKKRYVSYHLTPVYMFPEMLEGLSPGLRARMQGKSCFNFRALLGDEQLRELGRLTEEGLERFRTEGLV